MCSLNINHKTRLHPLTCLGRFCLVSLGGLVQGNKATLRGILEVFSSKVELQLCILSVRQGEGQFAWCKSGTRLIVFYVYINGIPWAHRRQRRAESWRVAGAQKPNPGHYLREKNKRSNKKKKGQSNMSNFAIYHQLHMHHITTTIGNINLSLLKYWDSTIFREGNLALV